MRAKALTLLALALVAGGCPATRNALPTSALADGTPSTYLSLIYGVPPQGNVIQLRSSRNGALVRRLASTQDGISALRLRDGSVLIFTQSHKNHETTIDKIDVATGRERRLRVINDIAYSPAISPSQDQIAYTTYPTNYVQTRLNAFLPFELAVLNLTSGARVSTDSDIGGHPFFNVVWSPDGRKLAVNYFGDTEGVVIMNAAHPEFRSAARVENPRGCSYHVSSWTTDGLIGAQQCGKPYSQTGTRLVEFSTKGRLLRSWILPSCAIRADAFPNKIQTAFIVSVPFGFGNGSCGRQWGLYTYELSRGRLRLVTEQRARVPKPELDPVPIGW